jgi:hypothetical protein
VNHENYFHPFLVREQRMASDLKVNLTIEKAVETAAIQPKPACAGFKALDFWLVRVGGLGMQ